MVDFSDLVKIEENVWEIPVTFRSDMRVPARLFASRLMLDDILSDKTVEQLVNMTTLPGAIGWAAAMPDAHQGYGFCIGGVLATELPDGVISPGGVGYDINCGVRLLSSDLQVEEIEKHIPKLMTIIDRNCPSGVGKGSKIRLTSSDLDQILVEGSNWARMKGYASPEDLLHTESRGRLPHADPATLSNRARQRGTPQLGTLGAGNHFIEIDRVEEILDQQTADILGIRLDQVLVQIHTGSRGLGHQVASDYVRRFQGAIKKYGITLPDRELVCAPLSSRDGQDYLGAMSAAANYAFNNRQLLTHAIRASFKEALASITQRYELEQIYDIAHNIAKIESHVIDGIRRDVCVHRKGATRAFGPGFAELGQKYQAIGQPVLVPGSMGTASWLLIGTHESMKKSFGSTCHGAGRLMSRSKAKKTIWGSDLKMQLEASGIVIKAGSMASLAEEAPAAYKDVDQVVNVVHSTGLARKVARIVPLGVMKG